MNKDALYREALKEWGVDAQMDMIIEECAELIHALQRLRRDRSGDNVEKVWGEIADVEIMMEQARILFDSTEIEKRKEMKLHRLAGRLIESLQNEEETCRLCGRTANPECGRLCEECFDKRY